MNVKVCGVGGRPDIEAAYSAGAAYIGFVFYPPSPRALPMADAAALARAAPVDLVRVGLFVDPRDDALDGTVAAVALDAVQLHGAESPRRVRDVRARTGLPVIKAVRIRETGDLERLRECEEAADQLLCDAAPTRADSLPGGNGEAFDWSLLAGRRWRRPWILAGGLNAANVAAAIRATGASQVDVSTGVEIEPGRKSGERIAAFAHAAGAQPRTTAEDLA